MGCGRVRRASLLFVVALDYARDAVVVPRRPRDSCYWSFAFRRTCAIFNQARVRFLLFVFQYVRLGVMV
jgi:hypothetical protein